MKTYQGNPVSNGIAVGEVYKYVPYQATVEEASIQESEVEACLKKFDDAKSGAQAELEAIRANLEKDDPEKAQIFSAHIEILHDPALDDGVREYITDDLYEVKWAIEKTFNKFIKMLSRVKDDMIRERIADMQDVKGRLLRNCDGVAEVNLAALTKPVIVVAHDLFPSDTASLNRAMVQAIVTEVGGATSHTAIIARSYEIPALLGVTDAMAILKNDQIVAVDAVDGELITDPDEETKAFYAKKAEENRIHVAETKKYIDAEPITKDGVHIDVELNIASASVQELEGSKYTSGVGLFRSEFLYMGKAELPSEEEQIGIYKKVLTEYGDRPVILRTLDIGGDKKLDCMELPVEENPFLGNRALRLCFTYPDIFKTQLRAALRAAVAGNLWVMFPMVGSMDDIRKAKAMVEECRQELTAEGIPYGDIKIGIMIEIPSIAMIADIAVKEVDFASIGTNDLCQYLTAVDRMNPAVSKYYQNYHPAMFRLIGYVVKSFREAGKPVSVCGEMGGDKLASAVLIGLGMRMLSMGFASVAQTKKMINNITIEKAEEMAKTVQEMTSASEVEAYLKSALADIL